MAFFSIEHPRHAVHALLQTGRVNGFAVCAAAGLLVGSIIVGSTFYGAAADKAAQVKTAELQTKQIEEAIAKNLAERKEQQAKLLQLQNAPAAAAALALHANGITEDDVAYWRKQMDAYAQMTGVRMVISGRGPSKFKDASRLTVAVSGYTGSSAASLSQSELVQALDFLQLYGYVESFNGNEAVIHIKKV